MIPEKKSEAKKHEEFLREQFTRLNRRSAMGSDAIKNAWRPGNEPVGFIREMKTTAYACDMAFPVVVFEAVLRGETQERACFSSREEAQEWIDLRRTAWKREHDSEIRKNRREENARTALAALRRIMEDEQSDLIDAAMNRIEAYIG